MKQFYTFIFLLCAAVTYGQHNYPHQSRARVMERSVTSENYIDYSSGNRDVIYSSDFSNCGDWETFNAFDEGYTDYIEGINFECGVNPPSGPAAIDEIASTSAANGYMNVDSDQFGDTTGGEWIENCWFQNVMPINCTGYANVSLRFQTYYTMWDGGGSDGNEYCLVEVSNDGVNWPDVTTYEVADAPAGTRFELWPYMQTQDDVSNPTVRTFNISTIAGNQSTVYLRFRWKGTWGYSWMIDDLEVFETFANDLTVDRVFTGDFYNDYEYTMIPTEQVVPAGFPAIITNMGYADQLGTDLTLTVDGVDYTVTGDILGGETDTVYSDPIAYSNSIGIKEVTYTLPDDEDSLYNTLSKSFEVTDVIYSHATNDVPSNIGFVIDDEVSFGSLFIINANAMAGGIKVRFTGSNALGAEIQAVLYEATANGFSTVASSDIFEVTQNHLTTSQTGWVTIPFDDTDAVEVVAGTQYLAEFRKYSGTTRVYIRIDPGDDDNATICYGPFGANDEVQYYSGWDFTPAIQLVLDESINTEEVVVENTINLGNMPNPASNNTLITFDLDGSTNVALTVRDVTGKLVDSFNLGNRAAGKNTFDLNVSTYAPGMYSYTVSAGSVQSTSKLMVK